MSAEDSTSQRDAVLVEFLDLWVADRNRGAIQHLADYQERFPGYEDLIARAYRDSDLPEDPPGENVTLPVSRAATPGDLLGPYELHEEIGRGGQGIVYRATHTRTGRRVAVKVLKGLGPDAELLLAYFKREAVIAAKLDHPGLCPVYDADMDKGVPYIAMRYLEGETLARRLAMARSKRDTDGSLSTFMLDEELRLAEPGPATDMEAVSRVWSRPELMRIVHLVEKVAHALHELHEVGVIHRDVKPGNVMITPQSEVVIMDFGLARDESAELQALTRTGDLLGTPAYMSPEQLSRRGLRLDCRTDVWSLGVVLYECATLERPFHAPSREGLYIQILGTEPEDPRRGNPSIPRDLSTIIATALQKDRDHRYQTALDLAEDLRRLREGKPVAARPVPRVVRAWRWARREPARASAVMLLLLVATLAGYLVARWPDLSRGAAQRRREQSQELVARGFDALQDHDYGNSVRMMKGAMQLHETPEAVAGLVLAQLGIDRPEAALETMDGHRELVRGSVGLQGLRERALGWGKEDPRRQGPSWDEMTPVTPLDLFLVGHGTLIDGGQWNRETARKALDLITRAILASERPPLLYYVSRQSAANWAEEIDVCIQTAEIVKRRWPRSPEAWRTVGKAYGKAKRFTEAIAALQRAMELDPSNPWPIYDMGWVLAEQGRWDEADPWLHKCVEISATEALARHMIGKSLHLRGRNEEALPFFERATQLHPNDPNLWSDYGSCLQELRRTEDSIHAHEQAVRLDPTNPVNLLNYGHALKDAQRYEEAETSYLKSLELRPDYGPGLLGLGKLLAFRGKPAAAEPHLRRAVDLLARDPRRGLQAGRRDRDVADACLALEASLLGMNDLQGALEVLQEAVRLVPGSIECWQDLAIVLTALNQGEEAEECFRKAVAIDPLEGSSWCHLASFLWDQGRFSESVAALEKGKGHRDARPWLSTLREQAGLFLRVDQHREAGTLPETADLIPAAEMAAGKGYFEMAARWYRAAFEADPGIAGDPVGGHRYHAAVAALRAAASPPDGTSVARPPLGTTWRLQALEWFEADLAHVDARARSGRTFPRRLIDVLQGWLNDPDLESVRGAELLELPPDERRRWGAMWTRLRAIIEAAQ